MESSSTRQLNTLEAERRAVRVFQPDEIWSPVTAYGPEACDRRGINETKAASTAWRCPPVIFLADPSLLLEKQVSPGPQVSVRQACAVQMNVDEVLARRCAVSPVLAAKEPIHDHSNSHWP